MAIKASTRRFEFIEGNSAKFWSVEVSGSTVSVQFGLNSEAPRLGLGGGLSFVLGELDPDEGVHARRHRLRFWPRHGRTPRPPRH